MADAKIKPADPKETSVAVKGLSPGATEATLATLFAAHGKLLRVKLDKLGGAHVVFGSTRAAQRAALAANGAIVDGQTISAQHVRAFAKTTRPCRSFQEGKCRKGDQCKYWHPPTDVSSATNGAAVTKVPTVVASASKKTKPTVATVAVASGDDIRGIPKASICRNFAKGNCVPGAACRFAHVLGAGPLPPPTPASIPAQCSFFLAGRCTKGDECAFLHTNAPPQAPASKPSMCSFFAAGRCARGDQCAYVHEIKPAQAASVVKPTPVVPKAVVPVPIAVAAPVAVVKSAKKAEKKTVVPVAAPVDNDRTCIECEKPDVAVWMCGGCDDAKYCDECKTMVHRPKVMRSHTPEPLPGLATAPVCGECETSPSVVECEDCGVPYCESCDASVHQFKSLRNHTRTPVQTAAPPPQQKKVKAEIKTKPAPIALPTLVVQTPAAYIDSVPQLDLPSDSESSDESDDEDEKPSAIIQTKKQESSSESEEEDDEEEENEQPAAAALAGLSYVESVPKYDLPSESESDDEEDEDDDNDSVEDAKQVNVEAAFVAVKQKTSPVKAAPATALSSESSDSDSDDDSFEDERPVVTKPAAPTAVARPVVKTPAAMEISSESESDSDDEDAKPVRKTPAPVAAPKRKAESSSDSESASSDEDSRPPVTKQARVAAPVAPTRPVAKAPVNQKPGISTGSSHSLVKKIEAYEAGDSSVVMHLDPNLNGFERLLAHDCAERLGLNHVSVGEGLERHITIFRKGGGARVVGQKAKRS